MKETTADLTGHFGFRSLPFTREIGAGELFQQPQFADETLALRRAVERRMSAALTGPAGSGKTVLLRALAGSLPEARYRVHYVKVTSLSKRDMCREIARAVGAEPAGSYPALVGRLQERFAGFVQTDAVRPVLFLDEAHDMRPEVLSMLRILTNFEMDSRLVVSVVLCGQPALRQTLERPGMEDIAGRLAHHASLRLLSRDESKDYLAHRCAAAGLPAVPFDAMAQESLFEMSRGNMRGIDQLALKSLQLAADQKCPAASSNHVLAARKGLWL